MMNKNKGIVFWVTGYSGAGKTTISEHLLKNLKNIYGPTYFVNGDDIRNIFGLDKYDLNSRKQYVQMYSQFCKSITDQGINVLITVVGLFDFIHKKNRIVLKKNYVEIYLESSVKNAKMFKKKIYKKKNVYGIDIKAEIPKKPHIKITNNFTENPIKISRDLLKKIKKYINDNR